MAFGITSTFPLLQMKKLRPREGHGSSKARLHPGAQSSNPGPTFFLCRGSDCCWGPGRIGGHSLQCPWPMPAAPATGVKGFRPCLLGWWTWVGGVLLHCGSDAAPLAQALPTLAATWKMEVFMVGHWGPEPDTMSAIRFPPLSGSECLHLSYGIGCYPS